MKLIIKFVRALIDLRLKVFNLAIIQDIDTKTFNTIMEEQLESGWKKAYMYDGVDAWIDYGKLILKKRGRKLKFEWDNWDEGVLVGPVSIVKEIAKKHDLKSRRKVKWPRIPTT